MNVWDPQIQQSNEFSLSQIWLLGGSFASDLNSIEVGWQVTRQTFNSTDNKGIYVLSTNEISRASSHFSLYFVRTKHCDVCRSESHSNTCQT